MAIKIDGNFVCIGGFCFCETPTGLEFDGEAQSTLFCDLRPSPDQGEISGYTSGGGYGGYEGPASNIIDKFPFSSDTNAADVGNLIQVRGRGVAGVSSPVSGYSMGGCCSPAKYNTIDKFPFTSDTNASDVGDMSIVRVGSGGNMSIENGYATAGTDGPSAVITIDKFPFSSDTNGTNVASLSQKRRCLASASSLTHGYNHGGYAPPNPPALINSSQIDKFPFAVDTPATDIAESYGAREINGNSSSSHGYQTGGVGSGLTSIHKYPFAADANSTDVAELQINRALAADQSSLTNAYTSGGCSNPGSNPQVGQKSSIEKFSFSNETINASVGSLTRSNTCGAAGQQV